MGFFAWILYPIIWNILIRGALIMINAFQSVLDYITSDIIFDALFKGKHLTIANIPAPFFIFGILAITIIFFLFFIQYISLLFNEDLRMKNRIIKSLKNSLLSGLFTILMPIAFYGLAWTFSFFQKSILIAFGSNNNNLAQLLYYIGDPHWDGKIGDIGSEFPTPPNIINYNWITQILGTWAMMIIVVLLGIFIIKLFFELLVLFVTGPIAAATMVKDEGKIFKQWKDLVIGKVIIALATIVAFGTFMMLLSLFLNLTIDKFSFLTRQLFLVILIIGGGFMVLEIPQVVGSFVGHEVRNPKQWIKAQLPRIGKGFKHLAGFGKQKDKLQMSNNSLKSESANFHNVLQSQHNRKKMTGIPGFLGNAKRIGVSTLASLGTFGKIKQQQSFNDFQNSRLVSKYRRHRLHKLQHKAQLIHQIHNKTINKFESKPNDKHQQKVNKWQNKHVKANKKIKKIQRKQK